MRFTGNLALGLLIYSLGPLACLAQVERSPMDKTNRTSSTLKSSERESSGPTVSHIILLRRTTVQT